MNDLMVSPDKRWLKFAGVCAFLGVALIPYENQWAGHGMNAFNQLIGGRIREWLDIGEMYPSTEGIVIASALMLFFTAGYRWVFIRFGLGTVLLAVSNTTLKLLFSRQRPTFDRRNGYVQELPPGETGQWFGWRESFQGFSPDAAFMSYPSGHSSMAGFMAMYLTYHFPRGKYVWWTLAVLSMMHRFDRSRHYISDCFMGIAVGIVVCHFVMPRSMISMKAKKIVARLSGVPQDTLVAAPQPRVLVHEQPEGDKTA